MKAQHTFNLRYGLTNTKSPSRERKGHIKRLFALLATNFYSKCSLKKKDENVQRQSTGFCESGFDSVLQFINNKCYAV